MSANRFDTIARVLANRHATISARLGLAAGSGRAFAQEATPDPSRKVITSTDPHPSADASAAKPEFLFVQAFANGTWIPTEGEDASYTLTLTGSIANTIAFSDRPERIVELTPTQQFLDNLGFTPGYLPNAALVTGNGDDQDMLVIELRNPVYDGATLTYDATVLADYAEQALAFLARQQADFDFPASFGDGSLFIDDGGCPDDPGQCYSSINGNVTIIGDMPIETCSGSGPCVSIPCNEDGTSAHYGKLCAQIYPDQCSFTYTGTGSQWDCFGRGDGI